MIRALASAHRTLWPTVPGMLCLLAVGLLCSSSPPSAAAQDQEPKGGHTPKAELGVHIGTILIPGLHSVGFGGHVAAFIHPRVALEGVLQSRYGKNWLYLVEVRHLLTSGAAGNMFATYGAAGWFGDDQRLVLPVMPALGFGGQLAVTRYAAVRLDAQLMFGIVTDSQPVTGRLSGAIVVPFGRKE